MSDWLLIFMIPAIWLFLHSKWSGKLLIGLTSGLKQHAETNEVTSIAFPSISTGIYGYPIERAATIAVNTVNTCLKQGSSLKEIIFCCFSEEDYQVYQKALATEV